MKERTSIAIDEGVRRAAQAAARKRGVSLSRYVTEVLEAHLAKEKGRTRFPRSVTFKSKGEPWARDHEEIAFGP